MSDYNVRAVLQADVSQYVNSMKAAGQSTEAFKQSADRLKSIKMDADTSGISSALKSVQSGLRGIPESRKIVLNAVDNARSVVENLKSQLADYQQPYKVTLDADGNPAMTKIKGVHARLKMLEGEKVDTVLGIQDEATPKIAEVKSRLDAVGNDDAKPSVGVNDNATDHLIRIELLLERLEQTVTAVVNLQDNATDGLRGIESALENISQPRTATVNMAGNAMAGLSQLGQAGQRTGSLLDGLKNSFIFSMGQHIFQTMASGIPDFLNGIQQSQSAVDNMNLVLRYYNRTMGQTKVDAKGLTQQQEADLGNIRNYAQATIYSTTDMDQAYAQMTGTGVKNAARIVEAFGNIAAASENPKQAMQTIMTQMTQMAANGKADWADMRLVFESAGTLEPQVARELGMSVSQMQEAMSKGQISSQQMLDAVAKAANDAGGILAKSATQFHTIPQAMDGIKEDLEHKIQPAFKAASDEGIKMLTGLNKAIDRSGLGDSFEKARKCYQQLFKGFDKSGAGKVLSDDITGALNQLAKFNDWLANGKGAQTFGENVGNAIKDLSDGFSNLQTIGTDAGNVIKTAWDKVSGVFDTINQKCPWIKEAFDTIKGKVEDLSQDFPKLKGGKKALADTGIAAAGAVGGLALLHTGVSKVQSKFDGLNLLNPFNLFKKKAPGDVDDGIDSAKSSVNTGGGILENAVKGIGDTIGSVTASIGKGIAEAFGAFAAVDPIAILKAAAAIAILEAAMAGLGAMRGLIHPVFQDLLDGISQLLTSAGSQLPNLGKMFEDCGNGIKSAFDGVGDVIHGALDGVADIISSVGKAAKESGEGFDKMASGASTLSKVDFKGLAANLAALTAFNMNQGGQDLLGAIGRQLGLGPKDSSGKDVNSIELLANNLSKLGKAAASIDVKKLSGISSALKDIQSFSADKKGKSGTSGLASQFTDAIKQLKPLEKELQKVKKEMQNLSTPAKGSKKVSSLGQQFASALKSLKPFETELSKVKKLMAGLGGGKKGSNPFAAMNAGLKAMNKSITQAKAGFTGLKKSMSGLKFSKSFSGMSSQLSRLGVQARKAGQAIKTGLQAGIRQAETVARNGARKMVSAFTSSVGRMRSAGSGLGQAVTSGFRSTADRMSSAARSAVSAAVQAMSGYYNAAFSAGANVGRGLADGLNSMLGAVEAAGAALGRASVAHVGKGARTNSPSKATIETGHNVGEGLIIGIGHKIEQTRQIAMALGRAALPDVSIPAVSGIGSMSPHFDITLHSDMYMDGRKVGYGVARPAKEKNDHDARMSRLVLGYS